MRRMEIIRNIFQNRLNSTDPNLSWTSWASIRSISLSFLPVFDIWFQFQDFVNSVIFKRRYVRQLKRSKNLKSKVIIANSYPIFLKFYMFAIKYILEKSEG